MNSQAAIPLPLDQEQTRRLQTAVSELSPSQLQWISGYAAGLAAASAAISPLDSYSATDAESAKQLTVLFGSQTGNGEGIADALMQAARHRGFAARSVSLADFKPANLKRESLVTLVISTHGEGDPPDDAELLYEYLMSSKAPQLPNLRYSVLALGDSSYVNFCQTGREFDTRLKELDAERFASLVECDIDYDETATEWSENIVARLPELLGTDQKTPHLRAVDTVSAFDKRNPFPAEVLVNQKITGRDSSKDVRHIELSLEGSGLNYEPGDSLAVIAENPPQLVNEFLAALRLDAGEKVVLRGGTTTLYDALSKKLEITALNLGFLRSWAKLSRSDDLALLFETEQQSALSEFVDVHQIIDVVRLYPVELDAQTFVETLRRLSARSYSVSSSLSANPDEVHLTVAAVRYDAFGMPHWGAASTHLTERLAVGDKVSVFVEPNRRFRLPEPDRPIIMIGAGTGIAPFRAFIEERIEQGARGGSWLFFGARNSDSDFLYQLEWQRYLKQKHLTEMDVAFSRDQRQKIYVQHRMAEKAAALNRWIENGAAVYVCGDAKRMAGDVHEALIGVLESQAHLDRDAAELRLKELRSAGRYQRDVY
jgi:sulfite reductase (NADPH) flavoprotein alpha-component